MRSLIWESSVHVRASMVDDNSKVGHPPDVVRAFGACFAVKVE